MTGHSQRGRGAGGRGAGAAPRFRFSFPSFVAVCVFTNLQDQNSAELLLLFESNKATSPASSCSSHASPQGAAGRAWRTHLSGSWGGSAWSEASSCAGSQRHDGSLLTAGGHSGATARLHLGDTEALASSAGGREELDQVASWAAGMEASPR